MHHIMEPRVTIAILCCTLPNMHISSEAARHGTETSGPEKHIRSPHRHLSIVALAISKPGVRARRLMLPGTD